MQLTLDFSSIQFRRSEQRGRAAPGLNELRSFSLAVIIQSDADAISEISSPSQFKAPPGFGTDSPGECGAPVASPFSVDTTSVTLQHKLSSPFPELAAAESEVVLPFHESLGSSTARGPAREVPGYVMAIRDTKGIVRYELRCTPYLQQRHDKVLLGGSGVSCGLFQLGDDLDLLAAAIDPITVARRAHFDLHQLAGRCSNSAYWGPSREFRLRGFRLRIAFENPVFAEAGGSRDFFRGGIESVALKVAVAPDAGAKEPLAKPIAPSNVEGGCPSGCCVNWLAWSE
jgi:hypothetical protein